MTSKKVSELNAATELASDDLVLVVDVTAGESKKATIAQFAAATTAAVTSVDASAAGTGLTFSGGPVTGVGTLTLDGTLNVEHGGTGANSLTGYVKGVGISPLTAVATIPGSDVTGDISGSAANVTGVVGIANGGTGESTKEAAFDALAPTTARGDIILHNGTSNVRFGVGTDGQVLIADPTNDGDGVVWDWLNVGSSVIGVLPVANGGTGLSNIPLGSVLVGAGTNAVTLVAPGAAGQVLTSTETGWVSAAPSGGGGGGVSAVLVASPITTSGPAATPTIGLSPGIEEGDVLKWTSGAWAPGSAGASAGVSSVTATSPLKHTGSTSNVVIELFDPVPVNKGGTGTGTAFTPGSVVFAGTGGVYAQDNTRLFWDNTAKRLGIGANSSLVATLDVRGTVHAHTPTNSTTAYQFLKADGSAVLNVDTASATGRVGINTGAPSRPLHVVGTALFTSNVNNAETSTFENTSGLASASSTVAVTAGGVLGARVSAFSPGASGASLGTSLASVVGLFADTAATQLQIAAKAATTSIVIGTASDTKTYPQMTFAADGGAVTVNNGQSTAVNFVVKGSSTANLLNINATTNSVAINSTGVTGAMLTVFGSVLTRVNSTTALQIQNNASENVVTVDTINKRLGIAVTGAVGAALSVANAFNVDSGGIITKYGNATPSNGKVLVWSGTGFQTKTITGTGTVTVSYDSGTGNIVVNGSSSGGTTLAAGAAGQVQYNNGSNGFAANSSFVFNASTTTLATPTLNATTVASADNPSGAASGLTVKAGSSFGVSGGASVLIQGGTSVFESGSGGNVTIVGGSRGGTGLNLGAISISGGSVAVQSQAGLLLGTTAATAITLGRTGITTTINSAATIAGTLTQNSGTFSLTGTNNSTISTSTGTLGVTAAGALTLASSGGAISISSSLASSGGSISLTAGTGGAITMTSGSAAAFTVTGKASSTITTTSGSLTLTSAGSLNLGTATTTGVVIGRTSVPVTVNGFTKLNGSLEFKTLSATANAAVDLSDYAVVGVATAGVTRTITLPKIYTKILGRCYAIKANLTGSGSKVRVQAATGDVIETGASNLDLTVNRASVTLMAVSDGSTYGWIIVAFVPGSSLGLGFAYTS